MGSGCWPQCHSLAPPPLPGTGTLTKFTLVLYGTAPEGLPSPPESSGCKTLTSSQACVGQYLVLLGCGARGWGERVPVPKRCSRRKRGLKPSG